MKITINTKVTQEQSFEVAAWSETWVLDQGTYELTRQTKQEHGRTVVTYTAQIPSTLESDYFQSLFGGLACGKAYDSKQNAGKKGTRSIQMSPVSLLTDSSVEISEEEYDQVLEEATELLAHDIDICMRCLKSTSDRPEWMSGHAKSLAEKTELYSKINGVMGRRKYNRTKNGIGWGPEDTHL